MARAAGAKKGRGKAAARPAAEPADRLLDAALRLAARQGWRRTGLAEIAAEAGLPLDEAYAACPSKLALLARFHRRIDRAALAGAGAGDAEDTPRDRLFEVLMRRFDALAPYRPALRAILRDGFGDPAALLGVPALLCSMEWMLERAGVPAAGWRGRLRAHLLAGLYGSVLRVFVDDDSADLAGTMAALDRRLRAMESWLGLGKAADSGAD
jgi:AcrR family transcriptional regulator